MKVVITGSHFTPAQAVIEKLLEIPDIKIVYLGRKYARDDDKAASVESKILPEMGVKFIPITTGKLNRFFSIYTIITFLKTPIGFFQSFYFLLKEQPDLIISFGGFTGLPVVISGWLLSIPSIIHEQGLKMGLSNFISSFFATKIAVSFKDFKIPPIINSNKVVVTGNPIRQEFLNPKILPSKETKAFINLKSSKPLLLVTAGNQGSHKINLLIEDILAYLTKTIRVIHQTGDSKYDDFSNLKKYESIDYLAKKWIEPEDLSFILDNTDLVISRAGINTLIELSLKSVPSLIIPIPVGNEQNISAKYFSKLGLGEMIEGKNLTPHLLLTKIKEMLNQKSTLKSKTKEAKETIILDGDKRLVQEILLMENGLESFNLRYRE